MSRPVRLNIDVTKLKKEWFYKGAKGTYVTLTVWPNRDGVDQFGNDCSIQQDYPKGMDPREHPRVYVGNGKHFGQDIPDRPGMEEDRQAARQSRQAPPAKQAAQDDDSEIPF